MKVLKELEARLIHNDPEAPESEKNLVPKMRRALCLFVGSTKGKDGEDSIGVTQLGLKLLQTGDVQLEDGEFRLLEKIVTENSLGWPQFLHGQLKMYLDKISKS